jgi:hypothetical protein
MHASAYTKDTNSSVSLGHPPIIGNVCGPADPTDPRICADMGGSVGFESRLVGRVSGPHWGPEVGFDPIRSALQGPRGTSSSQCRPMPQQPLSCTDCQTLTQRRLRRRKREPGWTSSRHRYL